ncbi:MAG TPA: hypothetical protein VHW23_05340 [Kofleriaceae bacterium]|nr:hypothetical protein [Kofleriaceae bacterium]
MIKALAIGLGLVLGAGVVSAQPAPAKRAPKKKPPAAAPADAPAAPATPDPAAAPATTPAALPPAASPSAPAPASGGPAASPGHPKPPPMKTDEKAGANEALQRNAGYRNVSKGDEDCALAAFHQGNDLLNNGLFPQAVARYREALRCWDHPGIHYNLALALINLNEPIEVYDHLNEAIKYGASPITQDKFDHAREYLKLVAGQLADIEVSCDKPGAKVAVDGKEVFVAPGSYKAKVRVGKHTFYGEKEGYNARVTAPFIGPGETFRIELKLYTAEELTRYRRRWDKTWMPYAVIGGGALAGIIGGVFELSASSSYKDFDTAVAKCNTSAMGCAASKPGLLDMQKSGDTKRSVGFVGYGIAGVAITTGVVLAIVNRRTPYQIRPEDLEEEKDKAHTVSVAPMVSPGMAGALVQGHF